MKVDVRTPYGDRYRVDCETGRLTFHRTNRGLVTEGGESWTITGVANVGNAFGRRLPGNVKALKTLAVMPAGDLLYKNGKPRYTLCDLDHGTHRIHGNTEHHGIRSVHVVKE